MIALAPFLLVVTLTGSMPKVLAQGGFSTLDDCRVGVGIADFLVQQRGPMKIICIDTKTWETIISVSRAQ